MSSQYKPKATARSSRDNRVQPSELTPLNLNISANYQPRENMEEAQTTRTMDDVTKKVLTKIAIDLVLLCCGEWSCRKFPMKTEIVFLLFSRHPHSDVFPLRICLRARLFLRWRITHAPVPRFDSLSRHSVHLWFWYSDSCDASDRIHPVATKYGSWTGAEAFRKGNPVLGAKHLQVLRNLPVWCRLQSTHDRHCKILDRSTSTALHQRLPTDHARRDELLEPDQLQPLHRDIQVRKHFVIGEEDQGDAIIIPERPLKLLNVHDGLCRALPAVQDELERVEAA